MKKVFSILFLMVLTISCKCEETLTVYTLTEQEKTMVPYKLNDNIQWVDNNNTVHNSIVSDIIDRYSDDVSDCYRIRYNLILYYIQFDNFKYTVSLDKQYGDVTRLSINKYLNNEVTESFDRQIVMNDFSTIQFNDETYYDSVKIDAYNADGSINSTLIYSKTNGIEFILFADSTWYKRVA